MYYVIKVTFLRDDLNKQRNQCLCQSLFDYQDCVVKEKELAQKLHMSWKNIRVYSAMYLVYDSSISRLYYFHTKQYRGYNFLPSSSLSFKDFDFQDNFDKFLYVLTHNSNNCIASVQDVDSFLCDIDAGASPASLWDKYSKYRVFESLEPTNIFYDAAF